MPPTGPSGDAGDAPHFRRRAHGLCFSSPRPLPTWRADTGAGGTPGSAVDVQLHFAPQSDGVREDDVPWRPVVSSPHLDAAGRPLVRVDESPDGARRRFSYHDGAVFHVDRGGRHAWLDWPASMSLPSAWPYFTGPVLTWLLRLHGRVVLHAASVVIDGGAVLIAGPSGA
ncbi:MAG: hypothetical protein AAFX50_21245, partial [Acidobacteriota bacterium]